MARASGSIDSAQDALVEAYRGARVATRGARAATIVAGNVGLVDTDESFCLRDRVVYRVEAWLSQRRNQYIAIASVGVMEVLVGGLLWLGLCPSPEDVDNPDLEGFWKAWTTMRDPSVEGDAEDVSERILSVFLSVVGILFFSSILCVVVDSVKSAMRSIREGKTRVVAWNHTVILGWTAETTFVIRELCVANASGGGGLVVVLDERPKDQLELELLALLDPDAMRGTRVVFRTGSAMCPRDLLIAATHTAKAVIILAKDDEPNAADQLTLRILLTLKSIPYRMSGHVVVEVGDIDNAEMIQLVGGPSCETVSSHDIAGRLMVLARREIGMCKYVKVLLGFEGEEFHMREWPELVGIPFGDLIGRFKAAIPIGVLSSDDVVTLNPPMDREILSGDRLVVVAEDDDTYFPETPTVPLDRTPYPRISVREQQQEIILVCGWRRDLRDIVLFLDQVVGYRSELHIMTDTVPLAERDAIFEDSGLDTSVLENITIVHKYGSATSHKKMVRLDMASYTSCMICADEAFETDATTSDSHNAATVLTVHALQGNKRFPTVCELLDSRTIAILANNSDMRRSTAYCESKKICAQILAMVAENRHVKGILGEIFGAHGSSLAIVPVEKLSSPEEMVSFWVLSARAAHSRMILLGYQMRNRPELLPKLNPRHKGVPRSWQDMDLLALVAEPASRLSAERSVTCSQRLERDAKKQVAAIARAAFSPDVDQTSRRLMGVMLSILEETLEVDESTAPSSAGNRLQPVKEEADHRDSAPDSHESSRSSRGRSSSCCDAALRKRLTVSFGAATADSHESSRSSRERSSI